MQRIVVDATAYIARKNLSPGADFSFPRQEELDEIFELSARISRFFFGARTVKISPVFNGCGIVDECEGDVIANDVLYEIKAGDRPFRSVDVRQIIAYLSLNCASWQYNITGAGLFNPRRGIHFEAPVHEFCKNMSGLSSAELVSAVVYEISRGDFSR